MFKVQLGRRETLILLEGMQLESYWAALVKAPRENVRGEDERLQELESMHGRMHCATCLLGMFS